MELKERFLQYCKQVESAIETAPEAILDQQRPISDFLAAIADRGFAVRRAEKILTEALTEFPLHPFLLVWRARLRLSLITEKAVALAAEDARRDLEAAIEVSPNYTPARYDLAQLIYAHSDDAQLAAEQFGEIVERASRLLCASAAGRIKSLVDANRLTEAAEELKKWQSVFPDDSDLDDAAKWTTIGASDPQ